MTTVKYILLAIEIIGLCLFLFPIVLDVINFGNIFGTALFSVLMLITVYHERFFISIKKSLGNSAWKNSYNYRLRGNNSRCAFGIIFIGSYG